MADERRFRQWTEQEVRAPSRVYSFLQTEYFRVEQYFNVKFINIFWITYHPKIGPKAQNKAAHAVKQTDLQTVFNVTGFFPEGLTIIQYLKKRVTSNLTFIHTWTRLMTESMITLLGDRASSFRWNKRGNLRNSTGIYHTTSLIRISITSII